MPMLFRAFRIRTLRALASWRFFPAVLLHAFEDRTDRDALEDAVGHS
ncbi:hypothetical protein [Kribbella qitaiheensis]|nr:hypothetical protein [Kribbella qitaiheensis]